MEPSSPLSYLAILGLILLSAFFSASETAFLNCNKYKIKYLAEEGHALAKVCTYLIEKFDYTTIVILIMNNIVNVATSIIATLIIVDIVNSETLGTILTTIITTIVVFIFGELLPKNFGKAKADSFSMVVSVPLCALMYLLFPLIIIFIGLIALIRKLFIKQVTEEFTDDDFQNAVEKKSEDGMIDEEEGEIIIAAVDFGERTALDVLTKKENIIALNINKLNHKYLLKYLQEIKFSRIPVYEKTIDNIIGILHVRTYLKEYFHNNKVKIVDTLLGVYEVDPKIKLDDLFNGFKLHKTHIAIVKDKDKTVGMITMKDVLEELVDDIDEIGTSDIGGNDE